MQACYLNQQQKSHVNFFNPAGPDRTDYFSGPVEEALEAGNSQVCVPFGTIDDNDSPILEDIEFYQVSLSTNDNVDIVPELEIANVFIEDGDGMLNWFMQAAVVYRSHIT